MARECPGFVEAAEVWSVEDTRAYEVNTVWLGIPLLLLMENAGRAVADAVECYLGDVRGKKVVVYAGKGGNGGDAIVSARHLAARGADVTVYLLYDPKLIEHRDAQVNLQALLKMRSVKVVHLEDPREYRPEEADALIDGILGIGVRGRLREPVASALAAFNASRGLRVAIDVPTGLDPDTGQAVEGTARADVTVTMHTLKPGLMKEEAKPYVGEVLVAEVGMPRDAVTFAGPGDVAARVPRRPRDAYKGGNGKVLVVGGSYHYFGAPFYAASAALLAGADLSFLAAPSDVAKAAASSNPGIIPFPLKGEIVEPGHLDLLAEEAKHVDAVAIGPGLGTDKSTKEAVIGLLQRLKGKPVVIDADALKAVAEARPALWPQAVLTPHRGEARMLAGREGEPQELAAEIAKAYGATVIVKAPKPPGDVICSPDGRCRYNLTGHPAMAVGGTGDVLTGITAGFLARRVALSKTLDPLHIAAAAAWVSGRAGELAVSERGENVTTLDVLNRVQDAVREAYSMAAGGG
ncbi:MAG: NAD(P)H-hydrate dehydratase [Acidianus sp.]|nr:NAD(P)H-hydrate dehydratase [Acidianus sp.]